MVTGDNMITARAIARNCNILEGDAPNRVMEGVAFLDKIGGVIKICKDCQEQTCACSEDAKEKRRKKAEKRRLKREAEAIERGDPVPEAADDDDNMEDGISNLDAFKEIIENLDILARSRP
jgi:magnesium-transporting ATPase (P-type)